MPKLQEIENSSHDLTKLDEDIPIKVLKPDLAPRRLSMTLPGSIYQELEAISNEENISLGETARRAIKRQLFLEKILEDKDGKMMIEGSDGNFYYIVFDD
jgi:hypothetical protein